MNDDGLFIEGADPLWDEPTDKPPKKRRRRERVQGGFYLCPREWADRAAEATGPYFILALRLYRHWQMREPSTDWIAVTTKVLAGPGPKGGRIGRRRLVAKLEAAGLIEVMSRLPGRAVRVRILDGRAQQRGSL